MTNNIRIAVTAVMVLLLSITVFGQVNIEKFIEEDLHGTHGGMSLSVSGDLGNTDFFSTNGEISLLCNGPRFTTLAVAKSSNAWLDGDWFSRDGLAHVRVIWRLRSRAQPEFFAQSDRNNSRKMELRLLAGGGLRLKVYAGNKTWMWFGTSLMEEYEDLSIKDDPHPEKVTVLRSSNYLNLNLNISTGASLRMTGYVQAMPSDPGDFRLLGDISLKTTIYRGLKQTTTVHCRYDSEPPSKVKAFDLPFNAGMEYSF